MGSLPEILRLGRSRALPAERWGQRRHFKKHGLENRDEPIEQPIVVVLQALAATGSLQGCVKNTLKEE